MNLSSYATAKKPCCSSCQAVCSAGMKFSEDTIAAISTPPGEGGVSVIRVSGSQTYAIADAVFKGGGLPPSARKAGTFLHGRIVAPGMGTDLFIDEVILLLYRAPHSYTGEDVVEIQGHGGSVNSRRILQVVLDSGARLAEPGEFTKRAFLNGKMDLVQAEGVADLIAAKSDLAARAAAEQLEGRLSNRLAKVYEELVAIAADIESTLDFSEDDLPESVGIDISSRLKHSRAELAALLESWHEGYLLRDGPLVVIAGQPNAGKSTLMNQLLGRERAIVTDRPGTTRDTIEESFILNGLPVRLVDTAGLRETTCSIEKEGIERALDHISRADFILYVIDASKNVEDKELQMLTGFKAGKSLLVLNKSDLGYAVNEATLQGRRLVRSSLSAGVGIAEIKSALYEMIGLSHSRPGHASISARHRTLVQGALNALNSVAGDSMTDLEVHAVQVAGLVREAVESVGQILGRTYSEDLLDSVFSRFCVGK